jgi:hypothetical protein
MRIWLTFALGLAVALALSMTGASADPWPDYYAQTTTVDYVTVVPVFDAGANTWTFELSVDSGAPLDSTYGGVKALVVYQLGVDTALQPDVYAGFPDASTLLRPGWDINGGWETHPASGGNAGWGGVGWRGSTPVTYVHPGESDTTNFWAHWTGGTPGADDFGYLVHVCVNSATGAETFWARPNVIPEPASLVLLGLGGLGLLGFRRRKK